MVAIVASVVVIAWGRCEIRLFVPEGFHGLIRIDVRSNGDDLRFLFPSTVVDSTGVVHLKSVARFFGFRRVLAYRQNSGRPLPNRFSDEATKGNVCFWDLPTSMNPEACFFVGTGEEHTALLKDQSFLQELGRDSRNDPH
jgi:hypothetical protein